MKDKKAGFHDFSLSLKRLHTVTPLFKSPCYYLKATTPKDPNTDIMQGKQLFVMKKIA
jgi:hypothetical protein